MAAISPTLFVPHAIGAWRDATIAATGDSSTKTLVSAAFARLFVGRINLPELQMDLVRLLGPRAANLPASPQKTRTLLHRIDCQSPKVAPPIPTTSLTGVPQSLFDFTNQLVARAAATGQPFVLARVRKAIHNLLTKKITSHEFIHSVRIFFSILPDKGTDADLRRYLDFSLRGVVPLFP